MLYIFEDQNDNVYNTPDAYILSKKFKTINWGDTLKVYSVYKKGNKAITDYTTIQAMFYHEGDAAGCDSTYWVPLNDKEWYNPNGDVAVVNKYKIVKFDIIGGPKYFFSKKDLLWYIENVYCLDTVFVNDEYPSEE